MSSLPRPDFLNDTKRIFQEVYKRLKIEIPEITTPVFCDGLCVYISGIVIDEILPNLQSYKNVGLPKYLHVIGQKKAYPNRVDGSCLDDVNQPDTGCYHCAVVLDDYVFDPTFIQFDPNNQTPEFIFDREEYLSLWDHHFISSTHNDDAIDEWIHTVKYS